LGAHALVPGPRLVVQSIGVEILRWAAGDADARWAFLPFWVLARIGGEVDFGGKRRRCGRWLSLPTCWRAGSVLGGVGGVGCRSWATTRVKLQGGEKKLVYLYTTITTKEFAEIDVPPTKILTKKRGGASNGTSGRAGPLA